MIREEEIKIECYYGVIRSPEYLAHYGVRGMKWGVRRAVQTANVRSLDRHYAKAREKLAKLNARANIGTVNKVREQTRKGAIPSIATSALVSGLGTYAINRHLPTVSRLKYSAVNALGGAALSGALVSADAIRLKRLTSKAGHAKAVQKRNEFAREMKKSFKGTKYRNLPNQISSKAYEKYLLDDASPATNYRAYEAYNKQKQRRMRNIRG